jgi:hypothetical protein
MTSKLAVDKSVLDTLAPLPETTPIIHAGGNGKISFLFLLGDQLSNPIVWKRFFTDADTGTYSIYVHRAHGNDNLANKGKVPLSAFNAVEVPTVNSTWCALMGVEAALLNAALRDARNEQFVFISHDAVPLKGFAYIHNQLIERSPGTSKFCFAQSAKQKKVWQEQLTNAWNQRCVFRDFYQGENRRTLKHHQWIVLTRQHAHTVAQRARVGIDHWAQAWRKAAPDLHTGGEGCSDESVPITTLLLDAIENNLSIGDTWDDLDSMGVERKCLTYVNWYNCFTGTPLQRDPENSLSSQAEDLFRYVFDKKFDFMHETAMNAFPTHFEDVELRFLQLLTRQGFMFGRKFLPNATVRLSTTANASLADVLPTLWHTVDERSAATLQWQHLSGPGA